MSVKDEQNLILKQKLKELAERHSTLSKTSSGELELLRKDLDVAKSKFSKQSLEKEVTYKMLIDSLKTENEKIKQQLNQQNRVHNTAIDKMVNNLSKLKQTVPESQLHSMVRMALDHGSTHEEVIESLTNVGYKKEKIEEVLNHSSS